MFLAVTSLGAQPFYGVEYRPADARYDVIKTDHFDVIFQRGLDSLALRVANVAERSYPDVVSLAGVKRPLKLPVIISDYNDAANGFVSPFPFRMEVDASPIKGKILNPRHADWVSQVVPHELAHAAQAEIRGGFGIGDLVRVFSQDWARSLNFGIPRGVTEGFAVSYESREPRLGRLNYTFTTMQLDAAAAGKAWTLSQVFDPPGFTRPFDRFYIGGGYLVDYLADSVSADFLVNSARFYNRWPFLGYGVALWQATGIAPWRLSRRFVDYAHRDAGAVELERDTDSGVTLTDEPGLACRRPTWIDDVKLVAYCSGYNLDRGFYMIESGTGTRSLLSRAAITEDYFFSLDRRRNELLLAEYRPVVGTDGAFRSHLKRIDLTSGRSAWIEASGRLYAPARAADGTILAIENVGSSSRLVRLDSSGTRETIFQEAGLMVKEVQIDSLGRLLLLANRAGAQSVEVLSIEQPAGSSPTPLVTPVDGSVYDPAWCAGGGVLFTADAERVAQVYRLDRRSDSFKRLTEAAFGAFEPSISPNGQMLAYVRYEHEQYHIVVQSVDHSWTGADSLFSAHGSASGGIGDVRLGRPSALDGGTIASVPARPYRAPGYLLRPRSVLPVIRFRESEFSDRDVRLDPGFGLSLSGTDPLGQWAYSMSGSYQEHRLWGGLSVQTGLHVLRPFVTISDRPRSAIVRAGGTFARVPYEERSFEIGSVVPIRLESGASYTSLIAGTSAEYRSIRFLDADANPVSAFDDRMTVNPFVALGFRLRSNPRDIVPNSGLSMVSRAEVDLQTEEVVAPSRSWRTDANVYVPMLTRSSTRVVLILGVLWQSQGSTVDNATFLPRGYDEKHNFLPEGTFLKAGLELIQPVLWVDRGLVVVPVSLEAVYFYGFAETLGSSREWRNARSSVGAGIGLRLLAGHHFNFDVRLGLARLLEENEWASTWR